MEKQLRNIETYKEMTFSEQDLSDLVDRINDCFLEFKTKKLITEKEYKYFTYKFEKTFNLGKFYLPPKIQKPLRRSLLQHTPVYFDKDQFW